MKVYSFWSGDMTYFTTSRSLRKAQAVGREVYRHYIETCKYLEEEPEVGRECFIPEELYEVDEEEFARMMKHYSDDVVILDDSIYSLIKKGGGNK
mgnify:CR=1 FL=1